MTTIMEQHPPPPTTTNKKKKKMVVKVIITTSAVVALSLLLLVGFNYNHKKQTRTTVSKEGVLLHHAGIRSSSSTITRMNDANDNDDDKQKKLPQLGIETKETNAMSPWTITADGRQRQRRKLQLFPDRDRRCEKFKCNSIIGKGRQFHRELPFRSCVQACVIGAAMSFPLIDLALSGWDCGPCPPRNTPPPTKAPISKAPTKAPISKAPVIPTRAPTKAPVTRAPTKAPIIPTRAPTKAPMIPTSAPTKRPTKPPTLPPTKRPTIPPTKRPTKAPTRAPTMAPTPCMTLIEYINSITLSNRTLTLIGPSPEDRALRWLAIDPLELTPCTAVEKFRLLQRYALLTLWFQQSLNKLWTTKVNWVSVEEECNWQGVSCRVIDLGPRLGNQSVVIGINLTSNNVYGNIPSDLGLLSRLETVRLSANKLDGTLPRTIGLLANIQKFIVNGNALRGTIPTTVTNWTRSDTIEIQDNSFTGAVPAGLCSIASLTRIAADCVSEVTCGCCTCS